MRTLAIHRSRIYCVRQTVPICVWRAGLVPCYCNNSSTADSSGRGPRKWVASWFLELLLLLIPFLADCDSDAFPDAAADDDDDAVGWVWIGSREMVVGWALAPTVCPACSWRNYAASLGSSSSSLLLLLLLLSQRRVHVWLLQCLQDAKPTSTRCCLLLPLLLLLLLLLLFAGSRILKSLRVF